MKRSDKRIGTNNDGGQSGDSDGDGDGDCDDNDDDDDDDGGGNCDGDDDGDDNDDDYLFDRSIILILQVLQGTINQRPHAAYY